MKSSLDSQSVLLCWVLVIITLSSVTSFAPNASYTSRQSVFGIRPQQNHGNKMMILDESILSSVSADLSMTHTLAQSLQSTSTFVSTISADIDNIANDEFGKVFLGGITVMIGGVASALMVGFLLESNNSYASIVADSYAQGGDEEFWEKLSPEDQVKAREMIAKLKASKEGRTDNVAADKVVDVKKVEVSSPTMSNQAINVGVNQETKKEKEAVSMFSDYDD